MKRLKYRLWDPVTIRELVLFREWNLAVKRKGTSGYVQSFKYHRKAKHILRYLANDKDEFAPHVDSINAESSKRFLVFFIYLDDNERGETNFPQLGLASPCKQGSLLMFPPLWPWVHQGMKPIEKPKYMVGSYLHYT